MTSLAIIWGTMVLHTAIVEHRTGLGFAPLSTWIACLIYVALGYGMYSAGAWLLS